METGQPGRHGPVVRGHVQIDLQTMSLSKQDQERAPTHLRPTVETNVKDDQTT